MKQGKHAKKEFGMNKRILSFVAAAAACCALVAGGTLAYFNAEEKAHNVITSGGVDIELNEWADLDKTRPFEDVDGVTPGASVVKVAEVENTGSAPAWVRVRADRSVLLADGSQGDASVVGLNFDAEHWTQGEGGWWYYGEALPAGAATEALFTHVSFGGPSMGNAYQGSQAMVDVYVQAVQSDNNSDSALTAAGWPEA